MTLSVVNLQEAYAKALLVDRARSQRPSSAGDVLGGHELLLDAYRIDVRPLCAKVRAELGAAEDPIAAFRAGGYAERGRRRAGRDDVRRGRVGPMSPLPRMAATVEDRWPARSAAVPTTRSAQLSYWPRTCSAPIARSRTSAAATPRPRARRRSRRARDGGDVGQGLGQRPRHDRRAGFHARCASTRSLPLFEREAMTDEEMVAYLARCQLDPARRAPSIETLLHAFIPAAHVHHTHPDAINALAGAADGERLRRRVLRRRGGLDSLHPARLHAGQAGRARSSRANPGCGSSCSPSTAS